MAEDATAGGVDPVPLSEQARYHLGLEPETQAAEGGPVTKATFHTVFTGKVPGGPCPVCHRRGELVAHWGIFDPGGQRTIVHRDEDGTHECKLPMGEGFLWSGPGPVWTYKPMEVES